jgi:hypothetical protein
MTIASSLLPIAGANPVGNFATWDTVQRHALGTVVSVVDPYWGAQELVYLRFAFTTGTPLRTGTILAYDQGITVDTNVPGSAGGFNAALAATTASTGRSVAFNSVGIPSATATGTYFLWGVISGSTPVWSAASVAADAGIGLSSTTAGQGSGTLTNRQVLNARVTRAATSTVVKVANVRSGSPVITVADSFGWFQGVSTTGATAAAAIINDINPDNRTITLAANGNTTGAVFVTGTYNDGTNFYNIVTCNRPVLAGAA